LIVGVVLLISLFPLSFYFWGSPSGLWLVLPLAGVVSVLAAFVLGLFNYFRLQANRETPPTERKE
jgi:hypothetical protein